MRGMNAIASIVAFVAFGCNGKSPATSALDANGDLTNVVDVRTDSVDVRTESDNVRADSVDAVSELLEIRDVFGERVGDEICEATCQNMDCGDDGCGGSCGECDDGLICTTDSCMNSACTFILLDYFCLIEEKCVPAGAINLSNPCLACQADSATNDWTPLEDGYPCGPDSVCFQGGCCDWGAHCEGAQCGDDGCGGSCGNCPDDYSCEEDSDGAVCTPQCDQLCQ